MKMKKLLITLLFITFFCNNAFAEMTSFEKKFEEMYRIIESQSYTPKQAQILLKMSQGYTDCSTSSRGTDYICATIDKLCLVSLANNKASIKCLGESDLDGFFTP